MKINDDRKKLFCCYFVRLGNIREAAVKAGFPPESALPDGIDCLRSPACKKLIKKLCSDLHCNTDIIMSGLERLAFGSSNDAVFLAFADELPSPDVISGLDLFNISEIKKVKGGGVEIKLFDRQKALEKMFEFAGSCESSGIADSFINALACNNEESEK